MRANDTNVGGIMCVRVSELFRKESSGANLETISSPLLVNWSSIYVMSALLISCIRDAVETVHPPFSLLLLLIDT